jgi:hypothetical protein
MTEDDVVNLQQDVATYAVIIKKLKRLHPSEFQVRYPLTPLTAAQTGRVTASSGNTSFQPWWAFDNMYGAAALVKYPESAHLAGWLSTNVDTTSFLKVGGVDTYGAFIYLDLSPDTTTAVITSFQFYGDSRQFPIKYQIVGSHDKANWESLFSTTQAVVAGSHTHSPLSTCQYIAETLTTKKDRYYRYVGILVETHVVTSYNGVAIQELLLYGI